MTIERFKLSLAEDTEGYITDKIKHKTYFLRGDTAKKEITRILNQLYNKNEDLKADISVLNRHYDEYANICAKLKKENKQLKESIKEIDDAELHLKQIILKRIDDYIWEWEDEGTPVAQVLRELRDEIKGDDGND